MEEDKFAVLNRIFGNDLTESVIHTTLQEANNEFDPAVEKLLTLPSNKPPVPVAAPVPLDGHSKENIQRLHHMFADLTQSVITTVYETNKRDVEGTVDTLLDLTSNEVASGVRREAEIARQEQEIRAYEEHKRLQQKLQEEERRYTEAVAQRAKEEEERRKKEEEQRKRTAEDAARRKAEEELRKAEQEKALREQERLLQEFQRKKVEEEERKKEEARKKEQERLERERLEKISIEKLKKERLEKETQERDRLEKEKKAELDRLQAAAEAKEKVRQALEQKRAELDNVRLEQVKQAELIAKERKALEERKSAEELILKKKFEEEKAMIEEQRKRAEAERKLLEERMRLEKLREEKEREKRIAEEKHFREEQEKARKNWDEEMKRIERERTQEEARRREQLRAEEEERNRKEADMRQLFEFERMRLDEQRRKVEEERRIAEEKSLAMEMAALRREEQERMAAEEKRAQEIEEHRRKEEEEARKREEESKKKAAEDQFAASAVIVTPTPEAPKVVLHATVDGTTISGDWELLEGALSPQAWVGVFPRRSINSPAGYSYVSGTKGEFQFKGLTPGHYEVRFFAFKPVNSRISETAALPVGPKVNTFTVQLQGDQLMLEYQLDPPSNPSAWDWVGIFERDQRRNKEYITSVYGNPSGAITAPLPRAPGVYQARLFAAGSKYNEQACVEFVVVDNDHVDAPQTVASGTPIKASWVMRTQEPSSSDWIGLFAVGEPTNNKYLSSAYTSGSSAGETTIPFPKEDVSGPFELRLFSSKLGKYTTFKTSGPIYVTQS